MPVNNNRIHSPSNPGHVTCVAILIPAYNESRTITDVIERLPRSIPGVLNIRIIVIDDGSSDGTAELARAAGADIAVHQRNRGLAAAFRTAITNALTLRPEIAVTMDADLQFDPDEIEHLTEPIQSGRAEFVAGTRFADHHRPPGMPLAKYWGNRLMTRLVNAITHSSFGDVSCGFRAYSYEALLHMNIHSAFTYTQETFIELAAKGIAIEQVPISVRYFGDRESYISGNLLRYGARTLMTIARTARDYAPFMIFGSAAFVSLFPGLLAALFVLGHFVATGSFSPYIFVAFAAAYLTTFGVALFILALASDMLRGIRNNQEKLLYFEKAAFYRGTKNGP